MVDRRGRLLRAALGFAGLSHPPYDRALWALRAWPDSWAGIGHVAVGMHRQGYDLQLTQSGSQRQYDLAQQSKTDPSRTLCNLVGR